MPTFYQSFLKTLADNLSGGSVRSRVSRRRQRSGATASIERLESRAMLSAVATVVEDMIPGGGINNTNVSSNPSQMIDVQGTTYFVASDGVNGTELWRINSSGVAEMVEDAVAGGGINPGVGSSSPNFLTNVNGTLYFSANDGVNGVELWRVNSSGVAEMVEDAVAGGGINSGSGNASPGALTNVNGTLYFTANDGVNGYELWRVNSSGVAEMVEDTVAGGGIRPGSNDSLPHYLTNVNGTLYFRANDGVNGFELWRINSSGVAQMVEDAVAGGGINPGSNNSIPRYLTNVNGTLYFTANDGMNGYELWRINSAGIAEMVEDGVSGGGISPGISNSDPGILTSVNGTLYFTASDGTNGRELWRITSSGVAEMVEDAAAGGGIRPGGGDSFPTTLTNVNGTLYFEANDGVNGDELWRINSSGVAEMVEDAVAGGGISPGGSASSPSDLTYVNGTLYFRASDGNSGNELWRINGSGVAEMVEDAVAGGGINPKSSSSNPTYLTNVDGTLYFRANDGVNGYELWRVNSSGVAEMVEDAVAGGGINPGSNNSIPRYLTNVNGTLYFSANDGVNGDELWRINSSGVAEMVEDTIAGGGINSGSSSPNLSGLTNVNGTLYFTANDGVNGRELWRINSSGVAEIVEDAVAGGGINPGGGSSSPGGLTNVNGTLHFSANDGVNGYELWRINSSGVAEMVEDSVAGGGINPGSNSSSPNNLTNVNGTLYFGANDGVNGYELWRINSSGVAEMVEDAVAGGGINQSSNNSFPRNLTNVNGTLYFTADDGTNGLELWRINSFGMAEMVEDAVAGGGINTGSNSSNPFVLTNVNGTLHFTAHDGVNGLELWRVNSSGVAEMVEVAAAGGGINPGSGNASPGALTNVNGTLYFTANDGVNGYELWRINSSGVAEMVEDAVAGGGINPGSGSPNLSGLTNVNGTLYFRANDGVNGDELWRINSSGVAEMVEDAVADGGINPGSNSSFPRYLTNANGTLYFRANDGTNGNELWRINSSGVAEMVEDAVAGGGINSGLNSSSPNYLTNVNGTLYLRANDGTNGVELWRINSSGVAEMVEDTVAGGGINPGSGSSNPTQILAVGGSLYFVADDGFVNGNELWVLSLNESPTDLSLSLQTVPENQPAVTTIGTFSTTDPDAGDSHTYTLIAGPGSTDNASFTIDGSTLKSAASFDFETKSSYSIRVRTTDQGGLSFEKVLTITVLDVDDTAPTVTSTSFLAAGTVAAGTRTLTVTFSEPVASQTASGAVPLGTAQNPAISAKQLLSNSPGTPSGVYWFDADGVGPAAPFQAYADMTTDGGGWMLAVNSLRGSESLGNEIISNTGTVALSTGHTRNVAYLATSQTAEIRHQIDASNQGFGILHQKYTGRYTDGLPALGAWTTLPGHQLSNILGANYGNPFQPLSGGSKWYTNNGTNTLAINTVPSFPADGPSQGPWTNGDPSRLINSYRIWVRETAAAASTPATIPAIQATGAADPASYDLRAAGADGLLLNSDTAVNPTSVSVSGNTATLTFATPFAEDIYRLTVKDAITDTVGNRLDGDRDGTPTGNWRRDFVGILPFVRSLSLADAVPVQTANNASTLASYTQSTMSADGRYTVFVSNATDLQPDQLDSNNTGTDVFLYDRVHNARRLVSHLPGLPSVTGNSASSTPSISGDGRYVVFTSNATNLVAGTDSNGSNLDVFLYDVLADTVRLISHLPGQPTVTSNSSSYSPVISGDGRIVTFTSNATNLVSGSDTNGTADVFVYNTVTGITGLASHLPGQPNNSGNALSEFPVISGDGNFVAFSSGATNLVGGTDANGTNHDVFLYNVTTETVQLVSHVSGASTTSSNGISYLPVLNYDGSFLAFVSSASNLVTGTEANGLDDVFLYSRLTDSVSLVSHAAGSVLTGNNRSNTPSISADGRYIAFQSNATNLVAGTDANGGSDTFLFDSQSNLITLVSHTTSNLTTSANGSSDIPVISSDGNFVAFRSNASNLVTSGNSSSGDIFRYARETGNVSRISSGLGAAADNFSQNPAISADGQIIAFQSLATNLVAGRDTNANYDVFLFNIPSGNPTLVSLRDAQPVQTANHASTLASYTQSAVSADGRYTVFVSNVTDLLPDQLDSNGMSTDVFLYDRVTNTRRLVSHLPGLSSVTGNSQSSQPSISGDGRFVVFVSNATNLVAGTDSNGGNSDVFLYDVQSETIRLISHLPGQPTVTSNSSSYSPVISGDGRIVTFTSNATNLVPGADTNGTADVFVYNTVTGITRLASHLPGQPNNSGNAQSEFPVISGDGNFVAFLSRATNLVGGTDTNGTNYDVFLYNVTTETVQLVSHISGASTTSSNGPSYFPVLNYDGSLLAFVSSASNLVTGTEANGLDDVFLYSRLTDSVSLVSHAVGSVLTGNSRSNTPSISADGRYIAFQSNATNLVAGTDANGSGFDAFVFDTQSNLITLVSHTTSNLTTSANGSSDIPVISSDGNFVAFRSNASNLVTSGNSSSGDIFRYARDTGNVSRISSGLGTTANGSSQSPAISADGEVIAFQSLATNLVAGRDANSNYDVFLFDVPSGNTTLASLRDPQPVQTGNNASTLASYTQSAVSADGRYTVFVSNATDLLPDQLDSNGINSDVFLYDRVTNMRRLVSHLPGLSSVTGNSQSSQPSISGDGRFVVFVSNATNLVAGTDSNGSNSDVFLYDVLSEAIRLISHLPGQPTLTANGLSEYASISHDGRIVSFQSNATNLVTGTDTNGTRDIFVYDTVTGVTSLVSHIPGLPTVAGNAGSSGNSVSGDGRFVVFQSYASNLVGATDNNFENDVFLYDVTTGTLQLVSHVPGNSTRSGGARSYNPVLSYDGAFIAFVSMSSDLVNATETNGLDDVFLYNRESDSIILASHAFGAQATGNHISDHPTISADGRFIAFQSNATNLVNGTDANGYSQDAFLFDSQTNEVTLVSHTVGSLTTSANGASGYPVISSDGNFVAFRSSASNLVSGSSSSSGDIFRYSRESGSVVRVSSGLGTTANGSSQHPAISADGQIIAFQSLATNLVAGTDTNSNSDVFLFDVPFVSLRSSSAFINEVTSRGFGAGQQRNGAGNLFDGYGRMYVGNEIHSPQTDFLSGDSGQTIVTGRATTGSLTVTREVTVPSAGTQDFARTVDVFHNPTGAAVATTVRIIGNLGSDAATTVFATSDGDSIVETTDQWIGTDDADGTGSPAILHYIHGPAGLQPNAVEVIEDNIHWTYNITVQPGEWLRLAHFTILATTRTDAIAAANALVTPSGFGGQAAAFLTAGELDSLANFQFGTLTATLNAGNLTIADPTGKDNQLSVSISGSNLVITDASESFAGAPFGGTLSDGNKTLTIPLASVAGSLTFNTGNGSDRLTIDLSGGNAIPSGGLLFNGGNPTTTPGDALVITGGAQGIVTYNYTNASDGSINMSDFGSISYTGLESITNRGAATNANFQLPFEPSNVALNDDGIVGNGLSRLNGATFAQTDFSNPTNSLSVSNGSAAEEMIVGSLPDFDASMYLGGFETPLHSVTFTGSVSLLSNNQLHAYATNGLSLTDTASVQLSGTNGAFLIDADADADGIGTYSHAAGGVVVTGSFTVIAADIDLQGELTATAFNSLLMPSTDDATIGVEGPGSFNLTNAELDRIIISPWYGLSIQRPTMFGTINLATTAHVSQNKHISFETAGSIVTGPFDYTTTGILSLWADRDQNGVGSISTSGGTVISSTLSVSAGAGITLNTNAGGVSITNRFSGDVTITELDSIALLSVQTMGGNGSISVSAGGSITGHSPIVAHGSGTISLVASGSGAAIGLNQVVRSTTGHITLSAADGVSLNSANSDVTTGGVLTINADADNNGTGTFSSDNAGAAINASSNSIAAADIVLLGTINTGSGTTTLTSTNGRQIDLGTKTEGKLGLTDTELDLITAATIQIGNGASGAITVTDNISQPGKNLKLVTGAGVSGTGNITNGSVTTTNLTIEQAGNSTFSGIIGGPVGGTADDMNLTFTKSGTGTLTLSSANTYTGTTTVNGGRLHLDGSLVNGPAADDVVVPPGGILGGTGTTDGAIRVQNGGRLDPGSFIGILTTAAVIFEHNSNMSVQIGGAIPGSGVTQHDQLVAAASVTMENLVHLDLTRWGGFVPSSGQSFTIVRRNGGSGNFAGLLEGATIPNFLGSGLDATITYAGGDGDDIVISVESLLPPTDLAISNQTVAENQPSGTTVGTFSSTDPNVGDTFTYSLVTGTGSTDNSSFTIDGSTLKTAASFDFETKSSYSIRVRTADQSGLWFEKEFTITVTNVTELNGIDVQDGQTQRSYLRHLDVLFDQSGDLMELINNGRLQLTKMDLNGNSPSVMTFSPPVVSGNKIRFDFGIQGIGGNRNTNAGDGYYEIAVDMDGDGTFESKKYFHRLLGDLTGDGIVDSADKNQFLGRTGAIPAENDVNGDGLFNLSDSTLLGRAVGRKLKGSLFRDD